MTLTLCPPLAEPAPVIRVTPGQLRALREDRGVKQTWLAHKLGISSAALCRYEKGVGSISEWRALRAMDILEGVRV